MDLINKPRPKIGFMRDPIGEIIIRGTLFVAMILTFYPFLYIIFLAVMPYNNFLKSPIHLLPDGFTLANFGRILGDPNIPSSFLNSIERVIVGASLSIVCTMMAAYAVSHYQMKYKKVFSVFFLIPMFFTAGIIPNFFTIKAVGIMNTFWALVLPHMIIPMWFFVARASLLGFPKEILEAANIDGAGQWRIFWQIVWPTNKPIIATIGMMYGVYNWNEYFMTRLIVGNNLWTAPVRLYNIMSQQDLLQGLGLGFEIQYQSFLAAMAACLIIPIFIVYPILQRFIISGMTVGAVKG